MTFEPMLKRRSVLGAALAAGVLPAAAQVRVEISGVGATQIPVAIARFRDEDGSAPLTSIVRADLQRSGLFRLIDGGSGLDENSQPAFADWRGRGADALVVGSATRLANGNFDVRHKLWDVVKGSDLGGGNWPPSELRQAAHNVADAVYQTLTGERGVFATRIAYVSKVANQFFLRIADADGENSRAALTSPEPIISPAWSPDGRELAYVSFESQKAVVWVQDVSTGARRPVANFRGSNSAPAWTPDGSQLAVTLSRDGGSQIYLIGRNGEGSRRLTSSSAIDTEPVFAPDGKSMFFVSDRGGAPQIYRMATAGGNAERVTFTGSYNISPAISPDGRTLAYVARNGSGFHVTTLDLLSGQVQTLSDTNDDESPSFAPNGRLLLYATRVGGRDALMTTTLDGKFRTPLATAAADLREPAWGPFAPKP